ncbi:MAG: hypothetical protein OXF23_04460 [Candidatus Dadabacteria bacterium]|nr:hypothetical protein [Candidatus Dadabacteria bacterium]
MSDDMDDAAQHLVVIRTARTMRLGEARLDSLKLVLTEPNKWAIPPPEALLGITPWVSGS